MASIRMKWMNGKPMAVESRSILKWECVRPFVFYTLTSMIYGELMKAYLDIDQNITAYTDIKVEIKGVLKKSTMKAIIK